MISTFCQFGLSASDKGSHERCGRAGIQCNCRCHQPGGLPEVVTPDTQPRLVKQVTKAPPRPRSVTHLAYAWFCTCTNTHHDSLGQCSRCGRITEARCAP